MTRSFLCFFALLVALVSCGGGNEPPVVPTNAQASLSAEEIDSDPLILMPSKALLMVNVDARATLDNPTIGADSVKLVERFVPIGKEAGFDAKKDVDRVVVGSYAVQGVDVVAVLSGRFDSDKIALVAKNHTQLSGGGTLVESQYAGRTIYTVQNIGFSILTPKTAICGTEGAMRRVLDRIKEARKKREWPDWAIATLETKGAAFAIAGDLASTPLQPLLPIRTAAVDELKIVRAVGTFADAGTNVAGTMTYSDDAHATAGAKGIEKLATQMNILALTGAFPQIKNLQTNVQKADVQVTFFVDDGQLRSFLRKAPEYL